ncbi:hypothetical protein AB9F29_18195 [Falsihalocynthiibacter sp. S25ZX9]|uniref:hypothetical protein n=1 Tax=Falsihalocynthiibacter sp. S25ZX9 TaxID=3240870 RepID=UPI00350FADAA
MPKRPCSTGAAHWNAIAELRKRFPKIEVEDDVLFVKDGSVWTSTGVIACVDLALALIEKDLGREITFEIARILCVVLKRPGGQPQTSQTLEVQFQDDTPTHEVVLKLDLSRFEAVPLIAFFATKEIDCGTETDGRIPARCGAYRADQWAHAQTSGR